MGEIRVKALMENVSDVYLSRRGKLAKKRIRSMLVDAVVDTGAVMMLLPQDIVEQLGLDIIDKDIVCLADDRKIEMPRAGGLIVTIWDRKMICDCLVGPPGCEPLVGQLVMESLDLIPDPVKRTITPRPESPYRATLKMKQVETVAAGY